MQQSINISTSFVERTKFFQWLIASLPKELLDDPNSRSAALVLSFILLCNFVVCFIFLGILFALFDQSPAAFEYGWKMILGCVVNYALSGVVLRYLKNINLAANLSLVGPYICVVIGGWLTGGVFSPMLYFLIVLPVFAFMLTNIVSGVIWFTITISIFFTFWYVDEYSIAEPLFMITATDFPLIQFLMPISACFMLMVAVAIYESNSMKLKHLLSQERNILAFKAAHDSLTGLANREEFNTQIDMAIASARRSDYPLSLVYMDLDGFKPINDQLGHHAGDQVLQTISARLKHLVRGTDTVARLGGDEFAIILQGVDGKEYLEPILQKMLDSVSSDIKLDDGLKVNVYASLGVAFLNLESKGDIDGDTLCRHADSAMYLAKTEKNTWRFYDQVVSQAEDKTILSTD